MFRYWNNVYNEHINYYSGPNTYDGSVRTGAADMDNVRVLNENRLIYASIGDESNACIIDGETTSTTSTTSTTATTTTSSTTTTTSQSDSENC